MKKFVFFTIALVLSWSYLLNAQCDSTLPVSENFSDEANVSFCWNFIDQDGDGRSWTVTDLGGGNKGLQSESWSPTTGALSPNNWVITHGIDLTSYNPSGDSVIVTWKVRTPDWSFDKEYYSVYAATGNQIANFTSSNVSFSENLDNSDGSGLTFANRSLNISSLAGQYIYIAFRHHNSTDQNVIDIDDFKVSTSTSTGGCSESIKNFASSTLNHTGNGANTSTLSLPANSENILFSISDLNEKLNGKASGKYVENVSVSFINGSGQTVDYGNYSGSSVSSATIEISGQVKSITVSLADEFSGNTSSNMSISLSPVTYCTNNTPCVADDDGDGVCNAYDQCPGFDDTIDINGNGIPDGCETISSCVDQTDSFSNSSLAHSGSGTSTTTLTLPTGSKEVNFSISGIGEKLKGKPSSQYIENVIISYVDEFGNSINAGTYRGDSVNSANVYISNTVKSITVSLSDVLTGDTSSNMNISISTVNFCVNSSTTAKSSTSQKLSGSYIGRSAFVEDNNLNIKVYPNPASGTIFIKHGVLNSTNSNIKLYNFNGVVLRNVDFNSQYPSTQKIDLKGLSTGMYLLRVVDQIGNNVKTQQIIIR